MNKRQNSKYPKDWRKIAQRDWNRMQLMLKEEDEEGAAYFLQQSLEKYLKSFLLEHGWDLKKIHELDSLLEEAIKYKQGLESFRDLCERVSGYYFTQRYPIMDYIGITVEDIQKDQEEAQRLIIALTASSNSNNVSKNHPSKKDSCNSCLLP